MTRTRPNPDATTNAATERLEQLRVRGAAGAVTGAHTPETEAPVVASKLAAWQARCREIGAEEGPSIKQCKKNVHKAVPDYFTDQYGTSGERLPSWQQLCRDAGVEKGTSIKQCKKHLEKSFINIIDFVTAKKNDGQVHTYATASALRNYIKRGGPSKRFPLDQGKDNYLLKWMLIRVR
ncbi:hypothetical protein LTR09_005631 [Extremus antarcticus]|uniref:Uncharacterized protein n=1 Tax=Extremus antarcticus TaxID=702011 RepID=A0AAJ0GCC3_9PEZI|nr:hypothetical protein LTR09_005631 [Extremus antarcticus]